MPQQPTLRRAEPLDVVNLYRLVVEQGKNDLFGQPDEASALSFVLGLIVNGHVLVAYNKAGRIVGTIGLMAFRPRPDSLGAAGAWLTVAPPYRDSPLAAELLDISLRAIDKNGFEVHFLRSLLDLPDEVLNKTGFKLADDKWIRKGNELLLKTEKGRKVRKLRRQAVDQGDQEKPDRAANRRVSKPAQHEDPQQSLRDETQAAE